MEQKETGAYYGTVTAQYIEEQFTPHPGVLATNIFVKKHTGANIREFTTEVLESFRMSPKNCKFTTIALRTK